MSQKQQKKLRKMAKRMSEQSGVGYKEILKIVKNSYKDVRQSGNKGSL